MPSVFLNRGTYWARLKGDKVPGKWSNAPTYKTDRDDALVYATKAQAAIDKRNARVMAGADTLRAFTDQWLVRRREADHEWRKDRGRLVNHILPALGSMRLADITTAHVADLVHVLRFRKRLANRTARNIYFVLAAVLRDAALAGKIPVSPCTLTDQQLGPVTDKDPEWRSGALFTRDEAETLISDPRIPLDRQLMYGFGLLAGLRPGEAGALRWRHYDPTREPLGRLQVALSWSVPQGKTKATKTEAVRSVPVHPTLAAMLAEWRLGGWERMMGRTPEPDDLIVPLPPEVKLVKKTERVRGYDYTGRRWREIDLPALGWRARSVYDTKSTFITLAIDDGADPQIIRDRVTHTRSRRDAFSGYDRGPHWVATCQEVAKLGVRRLAHTLLTPSDSSSRIAGSEGGLRTYDRDIAGNPRLAIVVGGRQYVPTSCDLVMASLRASACSQETDEVSVTCEAAGQARVRGP